MIRFVAADNFQPFGKFRLELKPVEQKSQELGEVHLFTGVNGTGKTRILSILSALLGNSAPLVKRLKGFDGQVTIDVSDKLPASVTPQPFSQMIASGGNSNWVNNINNLVTILTNTPAFAYSGNAYVSDQQVSVLANLERPSRQTCLSFTRPEDTSKLLLQAIANLKIASALDSDETPVNPSRPSNPTKLIKALESTLTHITGTPFLFQLTRYPSLSLGVKWGEKRLQFDVLPDGLRSLIGWLVHSIVMMEVWVQGQHDPMQTEAIFLIDEIESHLHPAWQRKILPAFQKLFPRAQIFVATHSPFVIASLNQGWIYPLSVGVDGIARIDKPISANSGDSYVTVVEGIMGVKEWFDPETESLLAKFREARDKAYQHNDTAQALARRLASEIAQRGVELEFMMGRELLQMDRQLVKPDELK